VKIVMLCQHVVDLGPCHVFRARQKNRFCHDPD
jgi:hypothetical protein